MNLRTTYILFGVLMGLMGIFLLTQIFGKKAPDLHTYVLPSLHDITNPIKTDDIDRVEIERFRPTTETLAFYRDERSFWRLQKPNTRVESSLVNRVIDQLIRARRDENADLSADLSRLGLDSPRVTVTLHQKASDRQWTLNLGDQSAGGESALIYVTSSDLPKEPMGVRRSDLDTVFKSVNEFRSKVLAADSAFDVQSVKFKEPKKDEVALDKKDNKWRFEKPPWGE